MELPETNGGGNGSGTPAPQASLAEALPDAPAEPPQETPGEAQEPAETAAPAETREAIAAAPAADSAQARQAIQRAQDAFQRAAQPPRWPMYVRQVKQYLRASDEGFDERKWGFATIVEFLRACQREGVFRLERDRQGVLRVFPGTHLQRPISQIGTVEEPTETPETPELPLDGPPAAHERPHTSEPEQHAGDAEATPAVTNGVTLDGEREPGEPLAATDDDPQPARTTRPRRSAKKTTTGRPAARKSTGAKTAGPRPPRARKKVAEG